MTLSRYEGGALGVATLWRRVVATLRAHERSASVAAERCGRTHRYLRGLWGLLLAVPLMMVIKAVCDGVEDLQPIGRLLGQ